MEERVLIRKVKRDYYCNQCHWLFSKEDDLEQDEFDHYLCPECGHILEECDGTC